MRRIDSSQLPAVLAQKRASDDTVRADVVAIIEDVRRRGADAVRDHAVRLGDVAEDAPLVASVTELDAALGRIDEELAGALVRAADRVERFAVAQRAALSDVTVEVPGGTAGHRWIPVETVGAYAPGGRYPLPSSVLMTVVPARVAGVNTVVAASPRPADVTLAAASIARADEFLLVGGAQAVAALAFGVFGPRCDVVVGPGNRWVTAAKKYLYGEIGIEGLAGPSEVLVLADETVDPVLAAADLIAQAEHDVAAVPMLVVTDERVGLAITASVRDQLKDLATGSTASAALENGFWCVVPTLKDAIDASNAIAPEHLALHLRQPDDVLGDLRSYGSVFVGEGAAEAFADYGAGPNHVLPTAGGARYQSGLSVMSYLRAPTWLRLDDPSALIADTVELANAEGLTGHATAALLRGRPT